jgi:potassium efflux system protein
MRLMAKNFFWLVLLAALFLMPPGVWAQKQPSTPPPAEAKKEQPPKEKPPEVPNPADLILQANKFSNRLAVIQTKIAHGLDMNALEKGLQEIEASLAKYPPIIEQLKASPSINFDKLAAYRDTIHLNADDLEKIIEPLTKAIRNLAAEREQWLAERKRWQEWQSVLLTDEALDEVTTTFANAQNTIDSALLLINQQLQPLLAFLQKSGRVDGTINRLIAELDGLTQARRRALLVDKTAPMFSWTYVSQLKHLTWFEINKGVQTIAWPKVEFYKNQGWLLVLQILIALVVIFMIFRHRDQLMESERWRFLAERPLAAGLALGIYPFFPFMKVLPTFAYLLYAVVGSLAVLRLLSNLLKEFWQLLLLYALAFFLIPLQFFYFINLPEPLIQLHVFISALVGLGLCVWRALVSAREGSPLTAWLFRLGGVLFLVVLAAELGGNPFFAEYLFRSGLRTVGWIILAWLATYLACGGVEGLVHSALLQKVTLVRERTQAIIRRAARLVKVLISGITLAMILKVWGVYDNPLAAIEGILSWGVTIGSQKITAGLVLTAAAFLYLSFLLSWVLQSLLMQDTAAKKKMGPGAQQSLASLIHYALVFVGFLLALAVLGIDLTKITIMLGALGVGIGFGLQQIVNNWVCGIILLVERPIRVGDYIQLGSGDWAEVKRIGLRATRVLTFDRADIWIPNGDLITREVINWTFSDRFARLKLPVGVAYGSDTAQVLNILMEVANEDPSVVQYPEPYAFFNGFGDSSLNFELRIYLVNSDIWFTVWSRLYQQIERKLREAGIVIPFPQRDLHLRSVDQTVTATPGSPVDQPLRMVPNPPEDQKDQEDQKVKEDQKDEKDQKTQKDSKDQEDKEKE